MNLYLSWSESDEQVFLLRINLMPFKGGKLIVYLTA